MQKSGKFYAKATNAVTHTTAAGAVTFSTWHCCNALPYNMSNVTERRHFHSVCMDHSDRVEFHQCI